MLKDIVIPKKEIEVRGGSFEVRGLTLTDLSGMIERYEREINELFQGTRTFSSLIDEVPDLAAEMIARAAGEPDQTPTTRELPLGAQLSALEALWDLTVPDEKSLGKVLARLREVLVRYGGLEEDRLPDTSGQEDPGPETTGSES